MSKIVNLSENNSNSVNLEHKKEISKIRKQSRKTAKQAKCFYCGKETSSFCNSHSVPAFCLKNISKSGMLYYSNTFINMPYFDKQKGIKSAGTFQIICRNCDSLLFQDYENQNNYNSIPTQRILSQIALKNFLFSISKRLYEIEFYKNISKKSDDGVIATAWIQNVNQLDYKDYLHGFNRAKRLLKSNKDKDKGYYLFFYEKLPYVSPIAFQKNITLILDLEGNIINDVFNMSTAYHTTDLHLCIFPLQSQTVIMSFINDGDNKYKGFYKQFRKKSLKEKLKIINYIIFAYTEDFFIWKGIPETVIKDKELIRLAGITSLVKTDFFDVPNHSDIENQYNFSQMNRIPNLLSPEYAVPKETLNSVR